MRSERSCPPHWSGSLPGIAFSSSTTPTSGASRKLAEYLQQEFGGSRNVDCEYDLHGQELKRLDRVLERVSECAAHRSTDRILPDIIVHVRNTDDFNTLVVELKTQRRSTACDVRKLELMTGPTSEYAYQRGVLIQFDGLRQPATQWFPRTV